MKKILIIGSGNVAYHLSIALKNSGFEISQIFSRNLITSEKLASKIGCDFTNEIEKEIIIGETAFHFYSAW